MRPRLCVTLAIAGTLALRAWGQSGPADGKSSPGTACQPCHTAERPKPADAALAKCARVVSHGIHSAAEGPDSIAMNEKAEHYGRVVFRHKAHAEMSEMGSGCGECHHEATEGRPMRKCGACHAPSRLRDDLEKPDLRGAIHRQCVACHRQCDAGNRCGTCHAAAALTTNAPPVPATAFAGGILYKFHKSMTCGACHKSAGAFKKGPRSCETCHPGWRKTFDHGKTGLTLDDAHRDADCQDCHGDKAFATPPSCTACHTDKSWPANKPGKTTVTPTPRVRP